MDIVIFFVLTALACWAVYPRKNQYYTHEVKGVCDETKTWSQTHVHGSTNQYSGSISSNVTTKNQIFITDAKGKKHSINYDGELGIAHGHETAAYYIYKKGLDNGYLFLMRNLSTGDEDFDVKGIYWASKSLLRLLVGMFIYYTLASIYLSFNFLLLWLFLILSVLFWILLRVRKYKIARSFVRDIKHTHTPEQPLATNECLSKT